MYDFTFRLNLLFLNKDRKKRGIHNAQFLTSFECSVVVLKAVTLTSKSAQGFNSGY